MSSPRENQTDTNKEAASEEEEAMATTEEIEEDTEAADQKEADLVITSEIGETGHQEARLNASTVKEQAISSRIALNVKTFN